jgi:hypothetical protein
VVLRLKDEAVEHVVDRLAHKRPACAGGGGGVRRVSGGTTDAQHMQEHNTLMDLPAYDICVGRWGGGAAKGGWGEGWTCRLVGGGGMTHVQHVE